MFVDPIVEEIHQVRAKIFKECNNDLDQLLDHYKKSEAKQQHRIVTLEEVRAISAKRDKSSLSENVKQ